MNQPFIAYNDTDEEGRPYGGQAVAPGIDISWQRGPLGRGAERVEPNGAFVETVIAIAVNRLEFYQNSGFNCRENALAITKLQEALHWLNARTARREAEGVEGTHEGK